MPSGRLVVLFLVAMGCRSPEARSPARETGVAALGEFPSIDRDLRAYEAGQAAEIATLERWLANPDSVRGSLDSVGAAAAELGRERYVRLSDDVDRALVRWREQGRLDPRLSLLDSLRVTRKVLMIRLSNEEARTQ
jgi:hypothetical protein